MSTKIKIMLKIMIAIIIGILVILGMQTTSHGYQVGQSLSLTISQYLASTNIFCIEKNQLLLDGTKYRIISNVTIDGNVSTDHEGTQITDYANAKLAYILSADNGSNKESGPVQNALWNYSYTWMNTVGYRHAGLYRNFAGQKPAGLAKTQLETDAEAYANNYNNNNLQMTDNTNKNNLKVDSYQRDGVDYVRVGPFNWTLPGNVSKVEVKDQNGNIVQNVLYSSFNGNSEYFFGIDGITSDKDFYISIPLSAGVTKIQSVYAEAAVEVKGVHIWFLEGGSSQNLIIREPFTSQKNLSLETKDIQLAVKLSGYVWVDEISGKQSTLNGLYRDNDFDTNDILLDGITVRLKDKTTGQTVRETTTANGGAYEFDNVLIGKLEDYYIEFEYDGLTYTNVVPHIDRDNGSKAAENAQTRQEFNKNFSVVEGRTSDTGYTRDANGNEKHQLSYNIDSNAHTATLINNGQYTITANTNETGYNIIDHYTYGQEEIKNINLGLYEREMPDIALLKDLENVRVSVNRYQHVYNYSQRFVNQGEYGDGFNVGVKFGNKYGSMSYTRPIYQADHEYINENDKSKELQVHVIYRIALRNESTSLIMQVNNIVDYYDSRYTITKVGTGLDEQGSVTGEVAHQDISYNDQYNKTQINTNVKIDPQTQTDIYVEFALNREAVLTILNDGETLDNVVEINSYSVFDKAGNIYAGIDVDSNPGNTIPENRATYEDDTDSSPALKLEVANAREIAGKVFLDTTSNELQVGEVRQGSGAYEEGEPGIEGVEITLTENTGSGKVYHATTDSNGDFLITGFIPGDYTLTYTWGNETYTVQNYKGTVYDASRDQSNKEWYKENVDNRLTDALDDYALRESIDNEIKNIKNQTTTTIDKMNSTTPTMGIGVEYETTYTASSGDRYTYRINNVDFGIVERARQDLALSKRVKTLKVTLANGQIVTDITIDEDGNITGQRDHLTYMGPSENASPENGFIRVELDNELIQGATLEVTYEIKVTNQSELDYLSERFYHYGIVEGEVVTISPSAIIDYLDNSWSFEQEKNEAWEIKTKEEIQDIVAETVYNNEESTIDQKTILYTESLKEQSLEPTASASVDLNVSKILTTSEDISLGNETELVEVDKTGGSETVSVPGNYVPGSGETETDDGIAETVIVTPNTGENLNFILPITIGVLALVVLGVGIFFIKRRALREKR